MLRLPEEVRSIILEVGRAYEQQAALALDRGQATGLDDLRNAGAMIRQLAEDVRISWAKSLADFPNRMAKDADERNMPGSEVIRSYIDEVSRSGYEWPVEYVID